MRVLESFQRALLPLAVTLAVAGCAREQVKTTAPAAAASPAVATQGGGGMAQAMKANTVTSRRGTSSAHDRPVLKQ